MKQTKKQQLELETPVGCECGLCKPDQVFECSRCRQLRPYCLGQDDEYYELCTPCWAEVTKNQQLNANS